MRSMRASPIPKSSRPLPIGVKPSLQVRPPSSENSSRLKTRNELARLDKILKKAGLATDRTSTTCPFDRASGGRGTPFEAGRRSLPPAQDQAQTERRARWQRG